MLPVFGNKVLGCHNCGIDIWTNPSLSWTELSSSAAAGTSTITIDNEA